MTVFFRLDENISYKICEAAEKIGIPQEVKFTAPALEGTTGEPDIPWIVKLGQRGRPNDRRCVFLGDRLTEPERAAVEQAGLIAFFVPGPRWWRELRHLQQAAYFLRWFHVMVEMAKKLPPGSIVQLPPTWAPRADLKALPSVQRQAKARPARVRRRREVAAMPLFKAAKISS